MKRYIVSAVAVAALAIAISPAAHADSAQVIVNGQDITADTAGGGQIVCGYAEGYGIQLSGQNGMVKVRLDYQDRTKVTFVSVSQGQQRWSTQQGQPQTGSATATKTGNSYKVTGTIAPYSPGSNAWDPNVGTPVPFEIDVTCP